MYPRNTKEMTFFNYVSNLLLYEIPERPQFKLTDKKKNNSTFSKTNLTVQISNLNSVSNYCK
jgi:hypothetical protein